MQQPHWPHSAQFQPDPPSRPLRGVALLLALTSCLVMPLVYLAVTLSELGNRFNHFSLAPIGISIAVGIALWIAALVFSIRAIVVSGRVGVSRAAGIAALILSILATVTAAAAAALTVLMLGGGGAHGRPLRVRGRPRTAPTLGGAGWTDGPGASLPDVSLLSADERAREAARWVRDAREEHASIAAFSRLSLDLLALGAPAALVERTHRAALDEVLHARLAFALAGAYAGAPVGPDAWPEAVEGAASERTADTLRRVAIESLVDGAYGEGLAGLRAGAESAADPAVAAVLDLIARDEAGHAALGWDLLAFCVGRDASLAPALVEAARALAARADSALERSHARAVDDGLGALLARCSTG